MFLRFAITAISTAFLAVAALAVVPTKSQTALISPLNNTIIEKNQIWPLKQNISLQRPDLVFLNDGVAG